MQRRARRHQRWLVVQAPPEKLWPLVKEFWQENGFLTCELELPETGVMETEWAENRAKIPLDLIRRHHRPHRRPRLLDRRARQVPHPPGAHARRRRHRDLHQPPRHEEVQVSNRNLGVNAASVAPTEWQPRPIDPGLEAEFLRRLMVRSARRRSKAKALAAPGQRRARARRFARASTAASCWRSTSPSTAPGAASASRSTASASPSRTATARRACTSCAMPIRAEMAEGRARLLRAHLLLRPGRQGQGRAVPGAGDAVGHRAARSTSSTRTAPPRPRRPRSRILALLHEQLK